MAVLSSVPTVEEKKRLEKLFKSKKIHFILLVVLIFVASLTFLFPGKFSSIGILALGVTIFFVGLSSLNLQHFQRCPRCAGRMMRGSLACSSCGLEYYGPDTAKQGEG